MKDAALAEFLDECDEMVERFSANLSAIESGSTGKDILAAIYRDMHTIKGSSQLFGFSQVGQLAHAMETCLDPVRKGQTKVFPPLVDSLYAGIDTISSLLRGIREKKQEPDLKDELNKLIPKLVSIVELSITGLEPPTKDNLLPPDEGGQLTATLSVRNIEPVISGITDERKYGEYKIVEDNKNNSGSPEHPGFEIFEDPPPVTLPNEYANASAVQPAVNPIHTTAPEPKIATESMKQSDDTQSETIRVHVSLLDNLMNLVGELVLIRNQLLQHAKNNDNDGDFGKLSQSLNILTAELQNEVMKTRMQPIGSILSKFSRVVRDMGRDLGKKIELELQGAETELDKTIIEAVKDPLTHIIRNAIDHGIESIAERKKSAKSEIGRIRIKAHHESGQVIIEIGDDGRGLDLQRIGSKAIEKGLITAENFAKMSAREVQYLIFLPGFSTASSVSNISGRGVGMDVVRTNVERIGGVVDLISVPDVGTTIKLKIPLTLAIVPALIVRNAQQRFAIPQTKLVELLRIDWVEAGNEKLEYLQGRPVLRLRGKLLPLVSLSEILFMGEQLTTESKALPSDRVLNIVVLNADNFLFGLIVEKIEDSADIVVKSLSPFLKEITLFSGATILGDGTVALTIDVLGISATARLAADADESISAKPMEFSTVIQDFVETSDFLLIDVGAPGNYAIPLTIVSRIEEFDTSRLELSGEQRVIRYRDSLLPIFSLPAFLQLPFERKIVSKDKVSVVVIRRGDRHYGINVEEILDVVSIAAEINQSLSDRPGILGTMIAQEKVIVVVDILGMIDSLRASIEVAKSSDGIVNDSVKAKGINSKRRQHRILIVEDSSFFRNHLRQIVQDAGFLAEIAVDGSEGFTKLENSAPGYFSLILSDIEMPIMDGLDLARKVRATSKFTMLPMLAITTRFSNADIEGGRQAGFTDYLEKLNAEKLIVELDALLCRDEKESKRATNF